MRKQKLYTLVAQNSKETMQAIKTLPENGLFLNPGPSVPSNCKW